MQMEVQHQDNSMILIPNRSTAFGFQVVSYFFIHIKS